MRSKTNNLHRRNGLLTHVRPNICRESFLIISQTDTIGLIPSNDAVCPLHFVAEHDAVGKTGCANRADTRPFIKARGLIFQQAHGLIPCYHSNQLAPVFLCGSQKGPMPRMKPVKNPEQHYPPTSFVLFIHSPSHPTYGIALPAYILNYQTAVS